MVHLDLGTVTIDNHCSALLRVCVFNYTKTLRPGWYPVSFLLCVSELFFLRSCIFSMFTFAFLNAPANFENCDVISSTASMYPRNRQCFSINSRVISGSCWKLLTFFLPLAQHLKLIFDTIWLRLRRMGSHFFQCCFRVIFLLIRLSTAVVQTRMIVVDCFALSKLYFYHGSIDGESHSSLNSSYF